MNLNFRKVYAICKSLLYPQTQILIVDKNAKGKCIKFKNGSVIQVIKPNGNVVRSKRGNEFMSKLSNSDGTVDYVFNDDKLNEILSSFIKNQ